MLARVLSCAIVGLDGALVEVEVDIAPGLPAFTIVGLPDAAVQEAKDRVRAAIRNTGYQFPMKRITVNLAPADLKKVGPSYDLPIAIGILAASGQVPDSWTPADRPAGIATPNGAAAAAAAPALATAVLPAPADAAAERRAGYGSLQSRKPSRMRPWSQSWKRCSAASHASQDERDESALTTGDVLG